MRREARNQKAHLAPDMRSVLVDQSLGWVTEEELWNDEKTDIFFAIKSLLKDVAAIAVSGQLNDASAVDVAWMSNANIVLIENGIPHASDNLATFFSGGSSFKASLNSPVAKARKVISVLD
jgi:hypothetical protein